MKFCVKPRFFSLRTVKRRPSRMEGRTRLMKRRRKRRRKMKKRRKRRRRRLKK